MTTLDKLNGLTWHDADEERPERSCTVYAIVAYSEELHIYTLSYSSKLDAFNCYDWEESVNDNTFDDVIYWAYMVTEDKVDV